MSIKDLSLQVELSKLYQDMKQAQEYAQSWASNVVALSDQIAAHPLYAADASAQDKTYIAAAKLATDTFVKAAPPIPDKVAPSAPVDPVSPLVLEGKL